MTHQYKTKETAKSKDNSGHVLAHSLILGVGHDTHINRSFFFFGNGGLVKKKYLKHEVRRAQPKPN